MKDINRHILPKNRRYERFPKFFHVTDIYVIKTSCDAVRRPIVNILLTQSSSTHCSSNALHSYILWFPILSFSGGTNASPSSVGCLQSFFGHVHIMFLMDLLLPPLPYYFIPCSVQSRYSRFPPLGFHLGCYRDSIINITVLKLMITNVYMTVSGMFWRVDTRSSWSIERNIDNRS